MSGIFQTKNAEMMFKHLQKKWQAFSVCPTEELLIDTLFPMYHLREWICPEGKNQHKSGQLVLTSEQHLYQTLHNLSEYEIVRNLCNRTKHYNKSPKESYEMNTIYGAQAGLLCCGDRLDNIYFIVDNIDIRDILITVYHIYHNYFLSP